MDDLISTAEPSSEVTAPSIETAPVIQSESLTPDAISPDKELDNLWKEAANPKPAEQKEITAKTEDEPETVAPEVKAETDILEEDDPLKEFDKETIPTDEEIQAKILRHVPKAERDGVLKSFQDARVLRDIETKLGGKEFIPILEAVSTSLQTPEATLTGTTEFLQTVATTNPNLMDKSAEIMFQGIWNMDEPRWQGLVDNQLQQIFGDGMTRDRIKELSSWMQAGMFDPEQLREDYQDLGFTNPLVTQLQAEKAELLKRLENEPQQKERQIQAEQSFKAELQTASDKFIFDSLQSEINPIIEKLAWAKQENDPPEWAEAKEVFGEMREAWIKTTIQNSPEAKNIKFLLENGQAFDKQGNPTQVYMAQVARIQGKAKAATLKAGRALQKTFTKSLLSSRNAQLTTPIFKPAYTQPLAPQTIAQTKPNVTVTSDADLDLAWRQVQQATQDITRQQRMMNGR